MMKADSGWLYRTVKIEGCNRLPYVLAQRGPVVGFGDDVFGQTLCHKAAVGFLGDFEDNLIHAVQITALGPQWQARTDREHRPQDSTGVLSLFDSFCRELSQRRRPVLHLLGKVILQAQLVNQIELRFEEIDVFLLVFQENLEEIG